MFTSIFQETMAEENWTKFQSAGNRNTPVLFPLGVIAPPYYWGINRCTGSFPGIFSLKPQTMRQVLFELMENLVSFSYHDIYCFNYHGDAAHVEAIVDVIKRVNQELGAACRLVLNAMELELYGWQGDEEFLLVVNPRYPMEWFTAGEPQEAGLLDIHAGAFETAFLNYFCPGLVDLETAGGLKSTSLNEEGLQNWLQGGRGCEKYTASWLCGKSGRL